MTDKAFYNIALDKIDSAKFPNFFIVGAMKCGTTALYYLLKQHPDIHMCRIKEPRFFCHDLIPPKDRRIKSLQEYCALFQPNKNEKIIGEASPMYFNWDKSLDRIAVICPTAKILISLRSPAQRLFSSFIFRLKNHGRGMDEKIINDFTKFFKKHMRNKTNSPVSKMCSAEHLQHVFDRFDKRNVKSLILEEWTKNINATCKNIYDFLDVDSSFTPKSISLDDMKSNKGFLFRSESLAYLHQSLTEKIRNYSTQKHTFLARVICKQLVLLRTLIGTLSEKHYVILPEDIYREITAFYMEDIKKIEKILDRDLSIWYGEKSYAMCKGQNV
ncbi:MAG: sulfotransferase family protein [Candidatus Omnitrophota bacterium]